MKIIGGILKGKKLLTLNSSLLRPTSNMVKETIFNILTHTYRNYLINQHFLDIFAGTGAIALEALSRGAKSLTLVENNYSHYRLIKNNLLNQEAHIVFKDFFKTYNSLFKYKFSLVFLDPPYNLNILTLAIQHLIKLDILYTSALIITESKKNTFNFNELNKELINKTSAQLTLAHNKQVGIKEIHFIKYTII